MAEVFGAMVDVLFGYDTDIHFENNDLMLTSGIDYLERELYKLLITEPGDWKTKRALGCSPNQFTGEQNTRDLGKKIESHIRQGLRTTVYPAQVDVRVVPTGYETLMIFVDILVQNSEVTSVPFEFDFINGIKKVDRMDERTTKPKSSIDYKVNNISNLKRPNKYLKQLRDTYIS